MASIGFMVGSDLVNALALPGETFYSLSQIRMDLWKKQKGIIRLRRN